MLLITDEPSAFIDLGTKLGSFGVLLILAVKLMKWLPEYMRGQDKRYDDMLIAQTSRHDALLRSYREEAHAERAQCKEQFDLLIQHSDRSREAFVQELRFGVRTPDQGKV